MEKKFYSKDCITLDGRMDEPVWETAEEYTGFRRLSARSKAPVAAQTVFKVLPCEDRIYVGVKCLEPDGMEQVLATRYLRNSYTGHTVELFFSPSGNSYEFYQFAVTINGDTLTQYYAEGGNIRPDPYKPDWAYAIHIGEDYWSIEAEIPLTAFYWTTQDRWSDKWLLNVARCRVVNGRSDYSTWSPLKFGFQESANYNSMEGFPIRPARDEVRIVAAGVELKEEAADGYRGTMTVQLDNAVEDIFEFSSDYAETTQVQLASGSNTFTVPCSFEKLGRTKIMLALTRLEDGKVFKRYYPVLVKYEPIKLKFTLPEFRCNFYPGQDYTRIAGTALSAKPVTLTLEGPGIEKTVISPKEDGSFVFDTPNFEEGDAFLTAAIDGYEMKKKIRRLAPTGHTMAWISGGNLIVNGKPVLRRNMYARYYRVGEAFKRRFDADDLHETMEIVDHIQMQPSVLLKGSEGAGGEATKDQLPSEEMFRKVDEVIAQNQGRDFVYYYLSDEPECRSLSAIYLQHLYEYIADKDPYHLLLVGTRNANSSVNFADWFETHPYICPYNNTDGSRVYLRPLNSLGSFVDKITKLNRPDKCIGFLPTCYGSGVGETGWDYPNFDEYILHTWAAMIHGGKTLWPYAGHDMNDRAALYEGTRYIFSSFEALEDLVLMGKRSVLHHTNDAEAVLYDNGAEKMFVLVNFTQQPQTVTVDGLTGSWHEFRGSRTFDSNTFQMKPLETIIGTNVVKGADLPTYAETAALIDKLEYARTHTGSLLFERAREIKITASAMRHSSLRKLFDGVADNFAGTVLAEPDNFIELDLTKVQPAFNKVVLRGYCIENAEVKIKAGENMVTPAVAETSCEEYAKTFLLAETVKPDALRLEFNGQQVELYEIEVF